MIVDVLPNEQGVQVVRVNATTKEGDRIKTFVDEGLLADALLYLALHMDVPACTVKDCPDCNPIRLAWWKGCNALSKEMRREVQGLMRNTNIALPLSPFEEEDK